MTMFRFGSMAPGSDCVRRGRSGSIALSRKDKLAENLRRSCPDLIPQTFILPADRLAFQQATLHHSDSVWIQKPYASSCGRSVIIVAAVCTRPGRARPPCAHRGCAAALPPDGRMWCWPLLLSQGHSSHRPIQPDRGAIQIRYQSIYRAPLSHQWAQIRSAPLFRDQLPGPIAHLYARRRAGTVCDAEVR